MKRSIGIDIGTTTICGVVLEGETGEILSSETLTNDTFIESDNRYEKIQDPKKILEKVNQILERLMKEFAPIVSIGITGQMHGMLYVNKDGEAVSPLYTWQDGRGELISPQGKTYVEYLIEQTEKFMATGFGITTHFFNLNNGLVPEDAAYLCTIGDFIGMKLSESTIPYISPSNAASLGCFKIEEQEFDLEDLKKLNISPSILPEVKKDFSAIGRTKDGIPVSVALGDNQASIMGSVQNISNTVLVNVGTGSQVSVGTRGYKTEKGVELRPFHGRGNILAGSSLCGGRAYGILEKFFREVVFMASGTMEESLYEKMGALLEEDSCEEEPLKILTRFSGTRVNPQERGKIENIGIHNLTPRAMIKGTLEGIVEELYLMYEGMCRCNGEKPSFLVGSGNGIRRNKHLQAIFEKVFEMKMLIPAHQEEASYGTALFSMVCSGYFDSIEEAQQIIKYQ